MYLTTGMYRDLSQLLVDDAVGWIRIDRRSAFPRLASSRTLKTVDDQDVWSFSCFFIDKKFRRQGLSLELLNAAIDRAKIQGASLVEEYHIDTPKENYPPVHAWTGFFETFKKGGVCRGGATIQNSARHAKEAGR